MEAELKNHCTANVLLRFFVKHSVTILFTIIAPLSYIYFCHYFETDN